ncbi:MAG: sigma-70 family RNA polymerase sigma factor [Planctomycetales bacterium]|nr:sigma-70 family RNA polymerase sigma factor [Planctomycetales bacterium]
METDQHTAVQQCLNRLRDGDDRAREDLLVIAGNRLETLTRKLKQGFPSVGRWEQTEDVCQVASLKLYDALAKVDVQDPRHFFALAAKKIRETLIDLARHYQGPQGMGANHRTAMPKPNDASQALPAAHDPGEMTCDPQKLAHWQDLHSKIEALPEPLREMFDLLWYHEMPQDAVAEIVGVSVRQVKRRWREAKLALAESFGGDMTIFE